MGRPDGSSGASGASSASGNYIPNWGAAVLCHAVNGVCQNNQYAEVQGNYYEPTYNNTTCLTGKYPDAPHQTVEPVAATWAGLGGYAAKTGSSGWLVQTGTLHNAESKPAEDHALWYEVDPPDNKSHVKYFTNTPQNAAPNDYMGASVNYVAGTGYAVSIIDYSNPVVMAAVTLTSAGYTGQSAEVVEERTTQYQPVSKKPYYAEMQQFAPISMLAYAGTTPFEDEPFSSFNGDETQFAMVDDQNQTLVNTSAMSSDGEFTETWGHCGDVQSAS